MRVVLHQTEDEGFYRVSVGGREVGCVRKVAEGWMPLGAFVFGPGLELVWFLTKEAAARALVRARLRAGG